MRLPGTRRGLGRHRGTAGDLLHPEPAQRDPSPQRTYEAGPGRCVRRDAFLQKPQGLESVLVRAIGGGGREVRHPHPELFEEPQLPRHSRLGRRERGAVGPVAQVRERELLLKRSDPRHVPGPVAREAADDGDDGGRRVDHPRHPAGHGAGPAGRHDEPVALTGGHPGPEVGEGVAPGVHELQDVVRPGGVRDVQSDRSAGEVEVGERVDEVRRGERDACGGRGRPVRMGEVVERRRRRRPAAVPQAGLDGRQAADERRPVDVRVGGQRRDRVRLPASSHGHVR